MITLIAVGVYSGYTIVQLQSLRRLQSGTIDRNRLDSLLLLRIQNGLNSVALAMRDMLDTEAADVSRYPITAWQPQFRRLRDDLEDALARESSVADAQRDVSQRRYLADAFRQFWDALDRVFETAATGQDAEARVRIRNSLQARQAALSGDVARLLVANNSSEEAAAARAQELYAGAERNVYLFLGAMLIVVVATGLYLVQYVRRLFTQVAEISEHRSELAQQLITSQENAFRSISRELHDEFGQILTAIGAMLSRADRRASRDGISPDADLREVRQIVQNTLEKVRTLSQALHPSVLDDAGLESALTVYLEGIERQTGLQIEYKRSGVEAPVSKEIAIHLYRIVQEAVNNVVRHAGAKRAWVRIGFAEHALTLEVEDEGVGYPAMTAQGLGLVSMRERGDLIGGSIEFLRGTTGGALIRVVVPVTAPVESHAD